MKVTMDDIAAFASKTVTEAVQETFGIHVELGDFKLRTTQHALGYGEIPYKAKFTFSKWCKLQGEKAKRGKE